MSLATRCTACGTIFRVVQDQLRVSEGWVRCGRCAEVFDAREQLFDIDREAPPPWPAEAVMEAPAPEPAAPVQPPEAQTWQQPEEQPQPRPYFAPEPAPPAPAPAVFEPSAAPETHFDARQEPRWVDEPATPEVRPEHQPVDPPPIEMGELPDVVLSPHLAQAAHAAEPPSAAEMPMPEFMRRAQNGERWRRPGVRAALGLCMVLLLGLLGLQVARHFHDAIVALYPQSRPALQALCEASGCELRPWRRIDALSVVNSALNQAGSGNQYQLAVSLYNKTGIEVATPWIELNLTDAAGTVVTRRMLAPSDFKMAKPTLAPGAELPLQLLLSTGAQPVSGYSVEIFHP